MTLEESLVFRETLKTAEKTLAGTLQARGYQYGSNTDEWAPEVRQEVATLALVRATLGQLRRSTARGRVSWHEVV